MKYVIYIRISRENKIKIKGETDYVSQELSLEYQKQECIKFCGGNPYVLYEDHDSSAGPHLEKRKVLMDAIFSLERGDVLVCLKPDRLARSREISVIKYMLRGRKASLQYADGTKIDSDDVHEMIMEQVIGIFSEYERRIIGMRTRLALRKKKEKGERTGTIPFGYKLDTSNLRTLHIEGVGTLQKAYKIVPCESEQKTITLIAELYNEGHSFTEMERILESTGHRNRRGNPISSTQIFRVVNQLRDQLRELADSDVVHSR